MAYVHILWLAVAACQVEAAFDDQPYCALRYKRLCQGKGRHVACHFPDPGPGASCVNYTAIQFTNDLKNFILYYVNRRRQKIAAGNERVRGGMHLPKPEIMMFVEWDRELAFLAQRLADQCHFVHDDCRATVRFPYAGQTVGEVRWRASGELWRGARRAIRRVLDAWWGERRRATPAHLTEPFRVAARGAVWGHFSQLCVWGLHAMGCGAVHHGASHPRLLLVCDFSHTNMLGQRTFTAGPLAPCPIHTMRRPRTQFPLLCAPVRRPIPSEPEDEEETFEDDSYDPGLTLELGDVPTPSIKYTRSTLGEDTRAGFRTNAFVFRESKTKGLMIEKLERELEGRNKAQDKSHMVTEDRVVMEWRNRKPSFGLWREQEEDTFQKVIPLQQQSTTSDGLDGMYYRPTAMITDAEIYLRHRWKQTRDRPMRPGANALLSSQPPPLKHSRKQSAVSLMLDKEDVDQLFIDTGFKMSWKKG